jgi:hypothetical protein
MLGVLEGVLNDGRLETEHGRFYTREYLQSEQREADAPEAFREFDFSAAAYFWVPDNYDASLVKPYADMSGVFWAWFI